jgi:hypothetical protein
MRLTRSRQRSSGHSVVAVLTPGPAGKAGPGLALFPGADGADRTGGNVWPPVTGNKPDNCEPPGLITGCTD